MIYPWAVVALVLTLLLEGMVGCAKHADFVEVRHQLAVMSRAHEHDRQRLDAMARRVEVVERSKDSEADTRQRLDEMVARLQKIEARLAKMEEIVAYLPAQGDLPPVSRSTKPLSPSHSPSEQTSITPTVAFNLAYNDYLGGKYELAAVGFQRFLKDFPQTSLQASAQYWLGESYYKLKDYGRALQAFETLVAESPNSEKMPAALYKLGIVAAEMGDLVKSRKTLKRVVEEFPSSDESRLAKMKLAEIR
ncbi:MAG: tol-pal system protein YbgF [Nitrospira sp.]|nr:tol-pal system protein YbgF [Nitrospira sp.]